MSYDIAAHERCKCKHMRMEHDSGFQECRKQGCACGRFTWDAQNERNRQLLAQVRRPYEPPKS